MKSAGPVDIKPQRQIKELTMNGCQLDHATILSLSAYFPSLETLRIMGNELTDLPDLSSFTNLKQLFLGNNPICDFTKLWHLSRMEK
jgi:Leucine-rich repeat (LRR) protein